MFKHRSYYLNIFYNLVSNNECNQCHSNSCSKHFRQGFCLSYAPLSYWRQNILLSSQYFYFNFIVNSVRFKLHLSFICLMKKQNLLSILWCHITTFDPASIYQFKMLKLDSADILNLIMVLSRYEPTSNALKDVTNLNSSTGSSKYYLQTSLFYICYLHFIQDPVKHHHHR